MVAHDFKYVGGRDRRQADLCEFKVCESHIVRPCLRKTEGGLGTADLACSPRSTCAGCAQMNVTLPPALDAAYELGRQIHH